MFAGRAVRQLPTAGDRDRRLPQEPNVDKDDAKVHSAHERRGVQEANGRHDQIAAHLMGQQRESGQTSECAVHSRYISSGRRFSQRAFDTALVKQDEAA